MNTLMLNIVLCTYLTDLRIPKLMNFGSPLNQFLNSVDEPQASIFNYV